MSNDCGISCADLVKALSIVIDIWHPGASLVKIDSFNEELEEISQVTDYIIVCGVLNVHHMSWLEYSSGDIPRGRKLLDACSSHGLNEMVGQPTRGDYLLDLVLCSHVGAKVQLGAMPADHASLLIKVPDAVETRVFPPRLVWQYEDADWHAIEIHLEHFDWHILTQGSVDDALAQFVSVLEGLMHDHIPRKLKRMQKSSLP